MYVNGKQIIIENIISLNDFLKKEGYDTQRVAVEKNGIIVPKKFFEIEMLCNTDKLEIVCFVGGG
ncbi:MAG: sulfur carrier protein ThiS [Endomicrobia bacterium]|nr:sulfur carrier protein ThiS [Endomicrobiia bacterium]MCL2507197.1 sulfur carrier protein ThiS [Endomicrobiia bacterium]